MEIVDLISLEGIVANLRATSKKQALQDLARRAADVTGELERAIFRVAGLRGAQPRHRAVEAESQFSTASRRTVDIK